MNQSFSRRSALKTIAGSTAAVGAALTTPSLGQAAKGKDKLKGNIRHSVCKWCYGSIGLDKLAAKAASLGMESVELLDPPDFPTMRKHGLSCAIVSFPTGTLKDGKTRVGGISRAFNRLEHHDTLVEIYEKRIKEVANAGLKNLICFSGNRAGMDDETGLKNCATGLKRILSIAEKHKVNIVMELLNSRVNHKDYMCDRTDWGVELCKAIDSERFGLLYDIYHMQIMEGDVIRTIRNLGWQPDLVHAFGWLSGLVPYVLRTEFGDDELFKAAKVVYTPDTVDFDAKMDEASFERLSLTPHDKLLGQEPFEAGQTFADAVILPPAMAEGADGATFSGDKEAEMDEATAVYDSILTGVPA